MLQLILTRDPATGRARVDRLSSRKKQDESAEVAKVYYLAEGAANVVFCLEAVEDGSGNISDNLLLRLRKGKKAAGASDSQAPPAFASFAVTVKFLQEEVIPTLGASNVVGFVSVMMAPGSIDPLNDILSLAEAVGRRPSKRAGWLLEEQEEALLLENMQPGDKDDAFLLDFKPKWLQVSPSSPPNPRRCRTCANDIRTAKAPIKRFCPLALASGVPLEVSRVVNTLLPALPTKKNHWNLDQVRQALTQYFSDRNHGHALLRLLRKAQVENDQNGIINSPFPYNPNENIDSRVSTILKLAQEGDDKVCSISKSMTFRDVSFFIKISRSVSQEGVMSYSPQGKFSDFDVKVMTESKVRKWISDELSLFKYYNVDHTPPNENEVCILMRQPIQ
jgi:Inositol-pentakisphosphate 2-kinase